MSHRCLKQPLRTALTAVTEALLDVLKLDAAFCGQTACCHESPKNIALWGEHTKSPRCDITPRAAWHTNSPACRQIHQAGQRIHVSIPLTGINSNPILKLFKSLNVANEDSYAPPRPAATPLHRLCAVCERTQSDLSMLHACWGTLCV
jgi:hypothetical protein